MVNLIQMVLSLALLSAALPATAAEREYTLAEKTVVIVNGKDPDSRSVADYYQQKRAIPDENIIVVEFPPEAPALSAMQFQKIYSQVQAQTPAHAQFYALAWSHTFRAGCMSITSAFAFGFDEKYCAKGCMRTELSPYFNVASRAPFDDFKIRPSMMLAGSSIEQVYAMIDRGVRSDGQQPEGTAYLMSTSDKNRNTRAQFYSQVIITLGEHIKIQQVNANVLENKADVMFYFTGLAHVKSIDSNRFLDGAMADHLTSAGGILHGTAQMSLLRWLDAGATASYGAVVEPCNYPQKFPHPGIAMENYIAGQSLIEAYWKSVAWPGQGLFVGEPLASPFLKSPVKQEELL